ncbi:hypothetical protein [Peribacillus sp. SCS-155]|uniref:hypothetical protein n=1 Tax=Peribacillus sedimenti TaxID=3115297 RepID=UPI00390577CE
MKKYNVFIILIILFSFTLFMGGCSSSTNGSKSTESSKSTEGSESTQGSNGQKVEVSTENKNIKSEEKQKIPFKIDDFVLNVTPTGEIDSAGGVYYSYQIKNNSPIPVQVMELNINLEFENGQSLVDNIIIPNTLMNGQSVGGSNETVYPEPASKIKSYQLLGYKVLDANGVLYVADLQLKKIDVNDSNRMSGVIENPPFKIDDFVLNVTPTGEIDSAGGVYYSYQIKNNSPIPVQTMELNVKLEFENGQSLVDNIIIPNTLMNGQSVGGSNETVYPEPASKIKSYQLLGYKVLDANNNIYNVDTQLKLVKNN